MKTVQMGKSMDDKGVEKIRNIGFIAHIDAGKTTTTERVLFYTGRTHRIGEVDEGTTTTDWMVQEKERGITITAAATNCSWKNYQINIIDTPGHVDFTVEVERSLKVLDGAVAVFCAQGGVEPQSETVWHQADKYNVSRLAFVNKMDKIGADFFGCVEQMKQKLGANPLILQLPYFKNDEFYAIIDILKEKMAVYKDAEGIEFEYVDVPVDIQEDLTLYKEHLIETLAEVDDKIMERFVEGKEIPEPAIIAAIRKATLANKLVPVFLGSSLKNKGVQMLLDGICRYLPSPLDLKTVRGRDENNDTVERKITTQSSFCGLCFKVSTDPYVGKLNYVRVYSGKIKSGDYVYNAVRKVQERVNKIVRMHANKQQIIDEAFCGDIVCLLGLKKSKTGDTLCDSKDIITLEEMKFPEPVISMAIEPKVKADQEKLSYALKKLSEEDPSFYVGYDKETGQTLISGMGQLHLEIAIDRLLREFKIGVHVGKPQVAYRETITKKVSSVGKFIQQTGGHGQYGHVVIVIEPIESGDIEFENNIKGGAIPQEFIPAVKTGILEASKNGVLAGYPVTNVKVSLIDGSYHEVDSSSLAFEMAASLAFNDGLRKASAVLLEPIMKLEIISPLEYLSTIIGDLNSRRAKIYSIEDKSNVKLIRADAPLSELFGYADILRNISQGRGVYTMEPAYYAKVPENIAVKISGK